ncbi:hypothetical protein LACPH_000499 [Lacticaseibacillus parahuelsenbergensis]|uniref:DUF1642 domain-containing protein n=2 Tax=Lacticaseibacillus TaxID=2759736 RepID=A0ABY9L491_9LACO|nr:MULTISPECIES: DUF1642 domain-containing protein [Lacticaseibacillus]TLF43595.1 DUF1642 domain-containing protein [Lacticaseibacillus zeae]WLV78534.1 hypothetical protein LACPH_000499 [Lacticaseibacillus sp. NCIMB 15471]
MSNETKRDVFDEVLDEWQIDETMPDANWKYPDFKLVRIKEERFKDRYDAALPDDLPVIPKEIGEYIERQKQGSTLRSAIIDATDFHAVDDEEADWIFYHSDTFALAWLLGVWRVEETGEIVKLEAEK